MNTLKNVGLSTPMAEVKAAEQGSTAAGSAVATGVAGAVAVAAKPAKEKANIVRGVMPVLLVYLIKFESDAGAKDADVAKNFGTTSGKVSDVRKGRNFAYLSKDFTPTKEQKDAAIAWMKQVPGYGESQDKTIVTIGKFPDASAEQAAAWLAQRAASRTKTPKEPKAASETSSGNGKEAAKTPAKPDPKAAKDLVK